MAKGIAITIGLNSVDSAAYSGWDGQLTACENDARSMRDIAETCGYECQTLLTQEATSAAVCDAIGSAALALSGGDHLLLTYSGHGGQVPDTNGDEEDGQDETWVLYDRMLLDDELYSLWRQFEKGVRIFLLSDSCHSGTIVKSVLAGQRVPSVKEGFYASLGAKAPPKRRKYIPADIQAAHWAARKSFYETAQWVSGRAKDAAIGATIIQISGCQDNQVSLDGDVNGLFTEKLLGVWNKGAFEGSYVSFASAIGQQMPPTQTPGYYRLGDDAAFEALKPFTIAGVLPRAASTTESVTAPTVTGPPNASDPAPTFTVDRGPSPYYIFEIATDPKLLAERPDPNDNRYYGSWNDPTQPARQRDATFVMPDEAWRKLPVGTLHYRVCATSSTDSWDGYAESQIHTLERGPAVRAEPRPPVVARTPARKPNAGSAPPRTLRDL